MKLQFVNEDGTKGNRYDLSGKGKHTPRPWYEAKTGNHQGLVVSKQSGENIAVTYDKDNAAFIVRACNHFDGLLEACRDAVCLRALVEKAEWLKRHAEDLRSDFNEGNIADTERQINIIIHNIEAAIEAAES